MRKLIILLLVISPALFAQTSVNGRVQVGTNAVRLTQVPNPGDQWNTNDGHGGFICIVAGTWAPIGGGGTNYQTIETAGAPLTQEPVLNFVNVPCVDNPGNTSTDCTVSYQFVLNNSSVLAQEPRWNAVPPLIATDNGANTRTDLGISVCAAGASHTSGVVADPGVSPDLTKFLRSDCTLAVPTSAVTTVPNPLNSANLSNSAFPFAINGDVQFLGSNPYVDARAYGVRITQNPNAAPAIPGITASINSGLTNATISAASTFVNGDGVVIWGAGATNTMSTPGAPTVTPSVAASETGSLLDVTGPTGSTAYRYQIVARDVNGGLTAASAQTNIANGQASLGPQQSSISAISLSGNTVTVTTSSAHTLAVGAMVVIEGVASTGGTTPFNGWFIVATVPDTTHFTYATMSDSRNGAATSGSGGNAHWWNSNHITWTAVTGAFQYYIYGRVSGSMALIGVSWPQNATLAGDATYLAFDDFGSTLTTAPVVPSYVPSTPPGAATNDMLITTISSGAGTTNLTLANAAGNTVSGATILFDDGVTLLAAATAANNLSVSPGVLYIPMGGFGLIINSPTTIPSATAVIQNNSIYMNETMTVTGVTWKGSIRPSGVFPQFAFAKTQAVYVQTANPGFYASDNAYFSFVTLQAQNRDSNNLMIQDLTTSIPASTFDTVQFALSNGGTDYMSSGLIFRSNHTNSGSGAFFKDVTFTSSQNTAYTTSCTPAFFADNFGEISIQHIFFSGRGMLQRSTVSNAITTMDYVYNQGAYMPFVAFTNALQGGNITGMYLKMTNVTFDTTFLPGFANLGGVSANVTLDSASVSGGAIITGSPSTFVTFINGGSTNPGINTSTEVQANFSVLDGIFGRTNIGEKVLNASMQLGSGYSIFTSTNPGPAPTCTALSGGSIPTGTWTYIYIPVWQNGSEGVASGACTFVSTTGIQTVSLTWTAIPGVKGYNVYRSNGGGYGLINANGCVSPIEFTASAGDSFGFTCGTTAGLNPAGGPVSIQGSNVASLTDTIGQYIDLFGQSSAPANPASGYCRTYYDSVAGTTKGINSSGTSCSPTGGGGSGTVSNALQNSFAIYTAPGTSNTIGGVAGPVTPASVPEYVTYTPNGSVSGAPSAQLAGIPVRTFSGSPSDTVLATDRNSLILETFGGAVTLNASSALFNNGFAFKLGGRSTNNNISVTPSTGTCNGSSFCTVLQGQNALFTLDAAGTNLLADIHDPPLTAGSGITLTRGDYSLTVSAPGAVGTTGSPVNGNLAKFSASTTITNGDLSGDCTTSGTLTITCQKVNGTSYPAGGALTTNTVPVVTGVGAVTYEAVPVAALASGATTANGQTCTLGSTCNVNVGAATHGIALNEGNGNAISGIAALTVNQIPVGVASADPVAGNLSELSATLYGGTDTGTSTAFAACSTPSAAALHTGQVVSFTPAHANTSNNPTLAWCGLVPKTIVSIAGGVLANNDIITAQIPLLIYDGTNFELQNPQTNIISAAVRWDQIGNPTANKTFSSAGFTTTFNQTSNVAWTWANTTSATNATAQPSPTFTFSGQYCTVVTTCGTAADTFTVAQLMGSQTSGNGTSELNVTHASGTTGATTFSLGTSASSALPLKFYNATSGSQTIQPATGALSTQTFTIPSLGGAGSDTFATLGLGQTFTGHNTISTAAASSNPALTLNGAVFKGTGTTSTPLFYISQGSAPTTFSTNGTEFGINAVSGFTGNLIDTYVNGGSSLFSVDSSGNVTSNNTLTSTSNAASSKQLWISNGANKTATAITFPETKYAPAANCVNATAGSGWSTGATPAALCRAGTNNKTALLSPWGASDVGYIQFHIPADADLTTQLPSLMLEVTTTESSTHTIIMQEAISCAKEDGSTTDDVAFNAARSFATVTETSRANQVFDTTITLNSTDLTGCAAPGIMTVKISRTTDTATNVGVYGLNVTMYRLLTVQAN